MPTSSDVLTPRPVRGEGTQPSTLLVVDDDVANLKSLQRIFAKEDFRVLCASGGQEALQMCRAHVVHVVLTDLMMPGMSGVDLIRALATVAPHTESVVMTAHGTIETAVEAMRHGAYDFVEKPLRRMHIVRTVTKALEKGNLLAENRTLRSQLRALRSRTLVGASSLWRRAIETAEQAAPSTATVLILGASGTGKELLARHVHEVSGRSGLFVGVNLAALPESIVESELFGHEKGAFTGATAKRPGRVEQAKGGTLFLDEIGELSPSIQVKLLRLLQEGEYEPLGGRTKKADFRLVAATNRDLEEAVEHGGFRADLYYRLNVIAIQCPMLRQRCEDIPLLVDYFLDMYCRRNGRAPMHLSAEAMAKLVAYRWPGNVRELENVIERCVVLARGDMVDLGDLPAPLVDVPEADPELRFSVGTPLSTVEKAMLEATLAYTGGDKHQAAQLLGISTRTIYRKLDL